MKKLLKYFYAVLLISGVIISASYMPASALTPIVVAPKAPSELTATSWQYLFGDDWRVTLEWQDNSVNESGFKIYRRAADSMLITYTLIDTVSANTTDYTDTTTVLGKTYYYLVKAYNSAGENGSNYVTVAVSDTQPDAATDLSVTPDSETAPTQLTFTWQDNSDNESGFLIYRRDWFGGTTYELIETTYANVESYTDSDIESEGEGYLYRVLAYNSIGDTISSPENTSIAMRLKTPSDFLGIADGTDINLTWTDNSEKEDSYMIYRSEDGILYTFLDTVAANSTSYTDSGLEEDTVYYYSLSAYFEDDPQYSSQEAEYAVLTGSEEDEEEEEEEDDTVILRFYIDSSTYKNGDATLTMDTAPLIQNNRTLLPIRYVAEPLGATVLWEASEQKVTITMGAKVIKLWIGSNTAEVDGSDVLIDLSNEDVTPVIVDPGRMMLPLRFVAENLGCTVEWEPLLSEVKITYNP